MSDSTQSTDAASDSSVTSDVVDAPPFATATHVAFPVIPPHDHAVLMNPRLVTIVSSSDTSDAQTRYDAWGDALGASEWWSALDTAYSLGTFRGNTNIQGPAITSNMTSADMVAYIDALVAQHPEIGPDGSTMYMLYLPMGIVAVRNGTPNTGCADLGVHANYHTGGDAWAWVQRCPPPPGTDVVEQAETTAAHEFAESATDQSPPHGFSLNPVMPGYFTPLQDSPWVAAGTEVGDLCEGSQIHVNGLGYQRLWSVTAAAAGGDPCVPALPRPYYNVTAPAEWNSFGGANTVTVPLTGWSTGPRDDWYFDVEIQFQSTTSNDWNVSIAGGAATGLINNGRSVMLTVTAPSSATSGDWCIVSVRTTEPMSPPPPPWPVPADGTDRYHAQWIGFYLP